jgi:hypothetical protein
VSDCFDHAADAYDDLCFGQTYNEGRGEYGDSGNLWRTCNSCGASKLIWKVVKGKWELCNTYGPHYCNLDRDYLRQ